VMHLVDLRGWLKPTISWCWECVYLSRRRLSRLGLARCSLFFSLVRFGVLLSCTIPGARELGDDVTVNSYDIMKNI